MIKRISCCLMIVAVILLSSCKDSVNDSVSETQIKYLVVK